MGIKLFHHPWSRAANIVWALEEVGEPYELVWVDFAKGEHKRGEVLAKNPMGKLPVLVDGDAVVTESAAIAMYLADRYALGRLAPRLDDPKRGTYLRWAFFAPSVIEPGAMAKASGWEFKPSAAGFGEFEAMVKAIDSAVTDRQYVLGDMFSIADVIFGGTLRYMTQFKLLDPSPAVAAYLERIGARPAAQRAIAKNQATAAEHGLKT